MGIPGRLRQQAGRFALVDDIPFHLPVDSEQTEALMAVFPINADKAKGLLPGNEVHPLRLWNHGLLVITVVNYQKTDIGRYIEYSIAIACTHGPKPAPRLLPLVLQKRYGTGQYVLDLPVSTEVSVKGGKGIWGMPKHQANLDFIVTNEVVSSQYDLDGRLVMKIEIERPPKAWVPVNVGAANYCAFRGMLMKSTIYFQGKMAPAFLKNAKARLTIGDHPRVQPLKSLEIAPQPLLAGFLPRAKGMLNDYLESWFLSDEQPPKESGEGLESIIGLGLGQDWLEPPRALIPDAQEPRTKLFS